MGLHELGRGERDPAIEHAGIEVGRYGIGSEQLPQKEDEFQLGEPRGHLHEELLGRDAEDSGRELDCRVGRQGVL